MSTDKIAIVCDSSVSLSAEEVEKFDVYIAPLTISHGGQSYIDEVTIDRETVNGLLRDKQKVTTSQPNIGLMIEILEDIKAKEYEHVIILSIGSALSGSHAAFQHAVNDVAMASVHVINTYSIAGPVQQGVRAIREMAAKGQSLDEILEYLAYLYKNQVSYIYPESLEQIVLSGRMSRTASKIATMLRVKPVLVLENQGDSIEKLGIARTDRKIFQLLVDDFMKYGVKPDAYDIYLLESEGMDTLIAFRDYLFEQMGEFIYHIVNLPAAVATHAGLGTIAIQWCPKLPQ